MSAITSSPSRLALGLVAAMAISLAGFHSTLTHAQATTPLAFGPVVDLTDGRATVATNTGPVVVQLGTDTAYERDMPGTLDELQPGEFVGVTGRPTANGLEAVEVHVFPAVLNSIPQGQSAMSGANAGNTMTNAVITDFSNCVLTFQVADGPVSIATTPATEVRHPAPTSASDVQVGTRIAVVGVAGDDGVVQATGVYIPIQQ
jgi:hypothetical protein